MSLEIPKNMSVYIIMVVLVGSTTFFNQVSNQVTQDQYMAIVERIEKLEVSHNVDIKAGSDHNSLFAHSGIFERTNQMLDIISKNEQRSNEEIILIHDRLLYLERYLNTGIRP